MLEDTNYIEIKTKGGKKMATLPIKLLHDENNRPFIPFTIRDTIYQNYPDVESLPQHEREGVVVTVTNEQGVLLQHCRASAGQCQRVVVLMVLRHMRRRDQIWSSPRYGELTYRYRSASGHHKIGRREAVRHIVYICADPAVHWCFAS